MDDTAQPDPDRISTRPQFGAALTDLRQRAGLPVRDLARRTGLRASTLGGYLSGRHLPALSATEDVRRLLEALGVTDPADQQRWLEALRRTRAAGDPVKREDEKARDDEHGRRARAARRARAPYRGLAPFQAADRELFFGRDAETAQVLDLLHGFADDPGPSRGMVAVVGPSGSGKSSLVRAGVAAAVRSGRLEGAGTCAVTTPSASPDLPALFAGHDIVVVDQFEECFTTLDDPEAFLQALEDRPSTCRVVLGLRADFYARAAQEETVRPALQHAQILVGPLGVDDLRAAIVRPAQASGWVVDEGLVELILADLAPRDGRPGAHDAGTLPLLSHALLATWSQASDGRMTIADYLAAGGLDGAIQYTAEQVYTALDPQQRLDARRLFLRLVNIDGDIALTRRRASWEETAAWRDVVAPFVESRLVTTDAESVEISHEALLGAWPRLRRWIDDDRAGLRLLRQVAESTHAWEGSGRDEGLLLRGSRLAAALEWVEDDGRGGDLDERERAYVRASSEAATRELARTRRQSRRLRQALVVAAVLAVLAGVLSVVAFSARSDAQAGARDARAARDNAITTGLGFAARRLLTSDPAMADQLALVAWRRQRSDTALATLMDVSTEPVVTRVLGPSGPTKLAVSPDGSLFAVSNAADATVQLFASTASGPPRRLARLHANPTSDRVATLAFSPDGHYLVVGGKGKVVLVWNVTDATHPAVAAAIDHDVDYGTQLAAFSPDGSLLVLGGDSPPGNGSPSGLTVWSMADPRHPRLIAYPPGAGPHATFESARFTPDGSALIATANDTPLAYALRWPVSALGKRAVARYEASGQAMPSSAISADGSTVYVGDGQGRITVLDAATLVPKKVHSYTLSGGGWVRSIALSPDGTRIAAGTENDLLAEWSLRSGKQTLSLGVPGAVHGIAYLDGGSRLAYTAADGALRLTPAGGAVTGLGSVNDLSFSANGRRLLVSSNGPIPSARLWDTTDVTRPVPLTDDLGYPGSTDVPGGMGALSPDGRLAAVGTHGGHLLLWDVSDAAHPRLTAPPLQVFDQQKPTESVKFRPDGRYLAMSGDDHTLRVVDLADLAHPRIVAALYTTDRMRELAYSPDGRWLAGADDDGGVYLWDARNLRVIDAVADLKDTTAIEYALAFSHDGRRIAVGGNDRIVRVWDVSHPREPRLLQRLRGPGDKVLSLAFSPDDHNLAVGSADTALRIYADSGHGFGALPRFTLRASTVPLQIVRYSADGRELLGGGTQDEVISWRTDPVTFAGGLCTVAGDPITRNEWTLNVPGVPYEPPCK